VQQQQQQPESLPSPDKEGQALDQLAAIAMVADAGNAEAEEQEAQQRQAAAQVADAAEAPEASLEGMAAAAEQPQQPDTPPTPPSAEAAPPAAAVAQPATAPAHAAPAAPQQAQKWSAVAARDTLTQQPAAAVAVPAPAAGGSPGHQPAPAAAPAMQGSWRAGADSLKVKLQQGQQQQQQQQQLQLQQSSSPPPPRQQQPAGGWHPARAAAARGPSSSGLLPQERALERSGADGGGGGRGRSSRSGTQQAARPQQEEPQAQPPAGRLLLQPSGQVLFSPEGAGAAEQRLLRLVRMLDNSEGVNNCFLNVIIQSLWHLRGFREALLALAPQQLPPGAPPADVRVLRALSRVFSALAQQPAGAGPAANGPASGPAARLSPSELREALSGLENGQVKMDLTDMHDASEVLGDILNSVSRAQLGSAQQGVDDPQLPKRVKVRAAVAEGAPAAAPAGSMAAVLMAGLANGSSAAAAGSGPTRPQGPRSMVQKLFGLEVQTPAPPEDDEDEEAARWGRKQRQQAQQQQQQQQQQQAPSGAQQQQQPVPGSAEAAAAAAAGASPPRRPPRQAGVVEVQQYIKYLHLVPAQGLRLAHDTLFDACFEEVLREADAADSLASRLQGGPGAGPQPVTLLRMPRVFTLGVVWESPQAPADAIRGTVRALRPCLELGRLFKGVPPGGPQYSLR
jgi:hypothetical protein